MLSYYKKGIRDHKTYCTLPDFEYFEEDLVPRVLLKREKILEAIAEDKVSSNAKLNFQVNYVPK